MVLKELKINISDKDGFLNELKFQIATARAFGTEVLGIELLVDEGAEAPQRAVSCFMRSLKKMKQKRTIEFFATRESFLNDSTEAVFLLNKYPQEIKPKDSDLFVYVKL